MKTTTALKTGATYGGPAVFAAGLAMFAAAVATPGSSRPLAQRRPAPTVTVTPAPPPAVGSTRAPAPHPSGSPPDTAVTTATTREPGTQPVSAAERRPGPGTPSGPSPAPPQRSTASCTGIATVRLLGRCALTIGGSR